MGNFNTSAGSEAALLESLGVVGGYNSLNALNLKDKKRICDAAKKVSTTYKIRRQALRALKKTKQTRILI